jgi:hypothetical protein
VIAAALEFLLLAGEIIKGTIDVDTCGKRCLAVVLKAGANPNILASFLTQTAAANAEAAIAAQRARKPLP